MPNPKPQTNIWEEVLVSSLLASRIEKTWLQFQDIEKKLVRKSIKFQLTLQEKGVF